MLEAAVDAAVRLPLSEDRMIEGIQEHAPESELHPFTNRNGLRDGHILVEVMWPVEPHTLANHTRSSIRSDVLTIQVFGINE